MYILFAGERADYKCCEWQEKCKEPVRTKCKEPVRTVADNKFGGPYIFGINFCMMFQVNCLQQFKLNDKP